MSVCSLLLTDWETLFFFFFGKLPWLRKKRERERKESVSQPVVSHFCPFSRALLMYWIWHIYDGWDPEIEPRKERDIIFRRLSSGLFFLDVHIFHARTVLPQKWARAKYIKFSLFSVEFSRVAQNHIREESRAESEREIFYSLQFRLFLLPTLESYIVSDKRYYWPIDITRSDIRILLTFWRSNEYKISESLMSHVHRSGHTTDSLMHNFVPFSLSAKRSHNAV